MVNDNLRTQAFPGGKGVSAAKTIKYRFSKRCHPKCERAELSTSKRWLATHDDDWKERWMRRPGFGERWLEFVGRGGYSRRAIRSTYINKT